MSAFRFTEAQLQLIGRAAVRALRQMGYRARYRQGVGIDTDAPDAVLKRAISLAAQFVAGQARQRRKDNPRRSSARRRYARC